MVCTQCEPEKLVPQGYIQAHADWHGRGSLVRYPHGRSEEARENSRLERRYARMKRRKAQKGGAENGVSM